MKAITITTTEVTREIMKAPMELPSLAAVLAIRRTRVSAASIAMTAVIVIQKIIVSAIALTSTHTNVMKNESHFKSK